MTRYVIPSNIFRFLRIFIGYYAKWNFVEMVSFADFISFYAFYYDYMRMQCEYKKHFESVRRIRNACAHNVCMLASLRYSSSFCFATPLFREAGIAFRQSRFPHDCIFLLFR